jgi:hypothetical protein
MVISSIGLAISALPASAAGCTEADFATGECLTAVVPQGRAPLRAAVAQAIARGETTQARHFVSNRGRTHHAVEQQALEKLFTDEQAREAAITATGSGTVSGYIHTLNDTVSYFYCSGSSCSLVGKVGVQYVTNIGFYPDITLYGELAVKQGPSVDFTFNECLSRWDANSFPDSTVHTWSNCPAAHNRDTWTNRALILSETWRASGTRGEKYYNRYRMTFKTSAGSQPSFGPWEWDTKRWYIPTSGGQPYWLV